MEPGRVDSGFQVPAEAPELKSAAVYGAMMKMNPMQKIHESCLWVLVRGFSNIAVDL